MTGVSIIHARQVPSSRRKSIPTAIRRVVERGRDRQLVQRIVEEVHRTPVIQTFPPVPIDQSPTVDHEKETREVLASLQLMHTVIIPFLTVTRMAVSATASPTMSTVTRLLFGLSTPVLQGRFTITTVKQKSPNGKSQKNGLNEKEERKRGKTEKKEILWQPKMDGKTESIWLPPNPANTFPLQRIFIEIIIAQVISEMETIQRVGTCPLSRKKKSSRDCWEQLTEDLRLSKLLVYTQLLFQQLSIDLLLLWLICEENLLFHPLEAYKMFLLQPLLLHAPTCMSHPHTLLRQI